MIEDDEDDDLPLDDDDPPTYAVLLRQRPQAWNFQAVSQALQLAAGLSMADAARAAKKRSGIMAGGLAEEDARDLVRALRAAEVDCFLVPEHELFPPPAPATVEAFELSDAGIRAIVSTAVSGELLVPWLDVAMLAAAHIQAKAAGGDVYSAVRRPNAPGRQVLAAMAPPVKKGDMHVLDVYAGYTRRDPTDPNDPYVAGGVVLRVEHTRFDFGCLGAERLPNNAQNVAALTRLLARRAPHAVLAPGAAACVHGGRMAEYEHLAEFQGDCLWQLDLLELERRKKERQGGTSS